LQLHASGRIDPETAITAIDVEQDASLLNDTATNFIN
jgi:hypothetical protein